MDPFLGEIRCFGFTFAPYGWLQCNGQILPISQYSALFSLLGTNFGGNGSSTFGLPNLQGTVPIGQGTGPGLSPFTVGQAGGTTSHTLLTAEMPSHNHAMPARLGPAGSFTPAAGSMLAEGHGGARVGGYSVKLYTTNAPATTLNPTTVGNAGGSLPHDNMQPSLVMNWCIAMQGVYPSRN